MVRQAAELGKKQRRKRNGKAKVSNSIGNEQSEDFVRDGGIALRGPCFVSVGARMHPPLYRIRRRRKACSILFLHVVVVTVRNAAEFGPYFLVGPGKIIFSPLCSYIHLFIPSTAETRKTSHEYGTIGGNSTGCVGCRLSDADVYGTLAARLRLPGCPV